MLCDYDLPRFGRMDDFGNDVAQFAGGEYLFRYFVFFGFVLVAVLLEFVTLLVKAHAAIPTGVVAG